MYLGGNLDVNLGGKTHNFVTIHKKSKNNNQLLYIGRPRSLFHGASPAFWTIAVL